jgi:hypothetical protein
VLAAVGLVAFVVVWFAPQALFINNTVDEPRPAAAVMPSSSPGSSPVSVVTAAAEPQMLASGAFHSLEHHTTGTALVLRLADGSMVVRLENLDTSNGPDVHVTLSPVPPDRGDRDYGDHLDLGTLKANRGNQNYAVPAGTDLARFHSVVIWCRRFSVGFGVAPIA